MLNKFEQIENVYKFQQLKSFELFENFAKIWISLKKKEKFDQIKDFDKFELLEILHKSKIFQKIKQFD